MSNREDIVGDFIQKVSEIQNVKDNEDLSTADLKEIATEIGMSEDDWEDVQKAYGEHLERGSGFFSHNNYDDALSEYQQALMLHPDSMDTLFGLATAHEGRFLITGSRTDMEMAIKFASRCLHISPNHQGALELISNMKKKEIAPRKKRTALLLSLVLSAAAIIGLIVMVFLRSV